MYWDGERLLLIEFLALSGSGSILDLAVWVVVSSDFPIGVFGEILFVSLVLFVFLALLPNCCVADVEVFDSRAGHSGVLDKRVLCSERYGSVLVLLLECCAPDVGVSVVRTGPFGALNVCLSRSV